MSTDPHRHLAIEEALLDLPGEAPPVVYFWRSRPAVVIGKNQIPWREADLGWMREQGVLLCRRSSGGGAVYHDEGNLNWTVCLPRARYSARRVTDCCLAALTAAGVAARAASAASLVADGAKISGMAYAYRKDRVLHHGTLLGDADLDRLRRALQPPAGAWETHAVRSEPMHVRNVGGAAAERFQCAFIEAFVRIFPDAAPLGEASLSVLMDAHAPRLRSVEWVLGRSPKFTFEFQDRGGKSPVQARVFVENGRVRPGSLLQCGGVVRRLREGQWFGEPCLRGTCDSPRPEFAALGDPAAWGGQ